jgi:hypothetical protein
MLFSPARFLRSRLWSPSSTEGRSSSTSGSEHAELATLLRFLGSLVTLLALGYAAALGVSLLAYPPTEGGDTLDTGNAWATIYHSEPRAVVLGRAPLGLPGRQIALLGASNVEVPFPTAALRPLLPGWRIPPAQRSDLTVVIGIWYGLFIADERRWKGRLTDIEVEGLRYGIYRRSEAGLLPVMAPSWLDYASFALRPLLAVEVALKNRLGRWRQRIGSGPRDLNAPPLNATEREDALRFWAEQVGTPGGRLDDAQFARLLGMVRRLSGAGTRMILLDLPLPSWHRAQSPSFADYEQRKRPWLSSATALPGVTYRNLQALGDDADFYDEVHPRPPAREKWVRSLAEILNERPAASAN